MSCRMMNIWWQFIVWSLYSLLWQKKQVLVKIGKIVLIYRRNCFMHITRLDMWDFVINSVWWRTYRNRKEYKKAVLFSDTSHCANIIKTLQRIQSLSLSILSFPILIKVNIKINKDKLHTRWVSFIYYTIWLNGTRL